MSSGVAYTPLNQGRQPEDPVNPSRNPTTDSSSSSAAPMAKAEKDDDMANTHDENKKGEEANNVPHVVVTEPHEEKSNNHNDGNNDFNSMDDFDRRSNTHVDHINLGDLRPNSSHSGGRLPHVGLNFDTELGSIAGETILPDINVYQHKKTLAQGMMDLALFSANANQLRYVLDSYSRHPYYWPSIVCICLSLGLQVGIGVGLIWNALYDVKDEKEICVANKINNWCVIGIFLVVVINVFVSSFGVADPIAVLPESPVIPAALPTT